VFERVSAGNAFISDLKDLKRRKRLKFIIGKVVAKSKVSFFEGHSREHSLRL
jgi:hypothetical protein